MEIIKLTTPLTEGSFPFFFFLKELLIIRKTFFHVSVISVRCLIKIKKIKKINVHYNFGLNITFKLKINFTYWYTVYEIVHSEKCVIRM